ncbi:MAG: hypothetical protein AMJ92_06120 [candidate division Zixibacteria bacterium SM23_81]|nr:MAG: hypothetical protein AMJ92_06120 [candidate division Zixibacteria bacterium SM23_81]
MMFKEDVMEYALYAALAFVCEYVDSTIGMGYGTTLTPLLLIMGFQPLQIVPAVLFSEFITGILAGVCHHRVGNVSFDFRRDEKIRRHRLQALGYIPRSFDAKVTYLLIVLGIIGALGAVFFSINVPKEVVKAYIGAMIFSIGLYIIVNIKRNKVFRWRKFVLIAALSGFNKGISGGGYGPLVTGGQVISGRSAKNSIGSTSLAEGLVCLAGFITYLILKRGIYWHLALPLVLGAALSTPLAAITVKKMPETKLKLMIGVITLFLGAWTLKTVFL